MAIDDADVLTYALADTGRATFFINNQLLTLGARAMRVEGVEDTVSGFLQSMTEGVILAFLVVVSHSGVAAGRIDGGFGFDSDVRFAMGTGVAALVFDVVRWVGSSAIITLSDIDLGVVTRTFDVNGGFRITIVTGLAVAILRVRTSTDTAITWHISLPGATYRSRESSISGMRRSRIRSSSS